MSNKLGVGLTINKLRIRTDKPHIFFRDGYWRVTLSGGGVASKL